MGLSKTKIGKIFVFQFFFSSLAFAGPKETADLFIDVVMKKATVDHFTRVTENDHEISHAGRGYQNRFTEDRDYKVQIQKLDLLQAQVDRLNLGQIKAGIAELQTRLTVLNAQGSSYWVKNPGAGLSIQSTLEWARILKEHLTEDLRHQRHLPKDDKAIQKVFLSELGMKKIPAGHVINISNFGQEWRNKRWILLYEVVLVREDFHGAAGEKTQMLSPITVIGYDPKTGAASTTQPEVLPVRYVVFGQYKSYRDHTGLHPRLDYFFVAPIDPKNSEAILSLQIAVSDRSSWERKLSIQGTSQPGNLNNAPWLNWQFHDLIVSSELTSKHKIYNPEQEHPTPEELKILSPEFRFENSETFPITVRPIALLAGDGRLLVGQLNLGDLDRGLLRKNSWDINPESNLHRLLGSPFQTTTKDQISAGKQMEKATGNISKHLIGTSAKSWISANGVTRPVVVNAADPLVSWRYDSGTIGESTGAYFNPNFKDVFDLQSPEGTFSIRILVQNNLPNLFSRPLVFRNLSSEGVTDTNPVQIFFNESSQFPNQLERRSAVLPFKVGQLVDEGFVRIHRIVREKSTKAIASFELEFSFQNPKQASKIEGQITYENPQFPFVKSVLACR